MANATPSPTVSEVLLPSSSLLHVNMTNITKLTSMNYITWSRQVHALFAGYDLAQFLDESAQPPEAVLTTSNGGNYGIAKINLLYGALLEAVSGSIQPLLSQTVTTARIWTKLSQLYALPSRGHIKQLKHQLKQWHKGSKSVDVYIQGIVMRFDQLALLGKVVDEDQVEQILEGLPEEYRTVSDQIEGREVPPSITELHEKLRNHEAKILAATTPQTFPASANYVNNKQRNGGHNDLL